MQTHAPEMLGAAEVAAKLGVSARTVYTLVGDGVLRCLRVKTNRTTLYRFRPEWIEEFIAQHTTGGKPS